MRRLASGLAIVVLAGAVGCAGSKGDSTDPKDGRDSQDTKNVPEVKAEGVVVTPADRERLGIAVEELRPAERQGRTEGFATVVSVAALGEVDSDLGAARVAAVASHAGLTRAEALYADQVSVSLAVVEAARRQAAADDGQVERLERRLALEWGPRAGGSPFAGEGSRRAWLDRLASGQAALARVQFPLGTVLPSRTPTLHLASLTAGPVRTAGTAPAVRAIWPAPEDPALPGPAFFTLITGGALPQIGERLRATADLSHVQQGVTIPESAIVLSGGGAWCFIEIGGGSPGGKSSRFVRRPVALPEGAASSAGAPGAAASGYFAPSGFTAGEKVVVEGAGLLLAHEMGAAAGGEEDD
ncbi:MAG: hypothetical protein ABJC13_20490 [Acidobacteriota bacterium]